MALIKKEEGWRSHPYLCPAGYPTIGWGHRIPGLDHPPISKEAGEQILWEDLRKYRDAALRISPGLADEPERRLAAITDFCFNCGSQAYSRSSLRTVVDQKNWKLAGMKMRQWVYATDPVTHKKFRFPGLVSRRAITSKWLEA